jgi:iron complex outermembrane recepter protein
MREPTTTTIAALILTAAIILPVRAPASEAEREIPFDIPVMPLSQALADFSRQANRSVIASSEITDGKSSSAVRETTTVTRALRLLLKGTELDYRQGKDGAIVVTRSAAVATPAPASGVSEDARNGPEPPRLKSPASSTDTTSISSAHEGTEGEWLDEIVVTAQKRIERVQEVPVPVTVISAAALVEDNQLSLQDYYSRIPGLNLTITDYGPPVLSIRGMTTGNFINPTTGIVVDEVPFASHSAAFPSQVPDLDPGDLARVEVLRGPQGTLYGASSMGGLLKYVTADPSTEGASGRLQAGTSSVRNGDELGYNVRGSFNLPVGDALAVRASAFTRQDPGYIDNALTGEEGINRSDAFGGRISALWWLSQSVSLKLNALHQNIGTDGSSGVVVLPGLGEFQQSNIRGSGAVEKRLSVYSATLTADLGRADLVSVSGYAINANSQSYDFSRSAFFRNRALSRFGVPGASFASDSRGTNFTQEARLSMPIGSKVDWLLGAFYNHEHATSVSRNLAQDPLTGAIAGVGSTLQLVPASRFREYAAFTNLTFHLTDRFDVQVGGRQSRSRTSFGNFNTGPFLAISPQIRPEVSSTDDAFTYLVTPRWRISDDLMVYGRLASGFRPGGPNVTRLENANIPPEFAPDETRNYEIGLKGNIPDYPLSFDASLYHIDWKDIQLAFVGTAAQGFLGYVGNAGLARSQGVELSAEARPLRGLTIGAWVSWNEAELVEGVPPGSVIAGVAGDRLPFSSRFSGNLSLDHEFDLSSSMRSFLGGSVSYVGDRQGSFGNSAVPQRQTFPSYTKTDVHAGLRYESWTANIFITNLTDERGVLYGGLQTFDASVFNYIQPRTVGLSIVKTFD